MSHDTIRETIEKSKTVLLERIGGGFESDDDGGVVRVTAEDTQGKTFTYVKKPIFNQYEADRSLSLYHLLRDAGIPVPDFYIIGKNEVSEDGIVALMEDLTQGGIKEVYPVGKRYAHMVDNSTNASSLQDRMVESLAVMHNLGVVDFHPGISFVLLKDGSDELGYRIIDYTNLCKDELPKGWQGVLNSPQEMEHDLEVLTGGITTQGYRLRQVYNFYNAIRSDGKTSVDRDGV